LLQALAEADARIRRGVEQVDGRVDHHEDRREEQRQPLISGMSRFDIASNASRPTPGQAKIDSVSTAPRAAAPSAARGS